MPRQVFTAGEILTAANMNDLSDQTVMVFDSSAARGSAIPTPSEGMVTYLKDTNQVQAFNGSAFAPIGTILQVVSTTKTDASFSTNSGTFTAVTGLTASITPSSTSSKIIVFAYLSAMATSSFAVRLTRGGAGIALGDAAGSRRQATTTRQQGIDTNNSAGPTHMSFLDSPSSTSALTYGVEVVSLVGATVFVNRNTTDTDNADYARGVSTMTVMEVAG